MKVAIFGTGYVGLVTGICLADLGHTIVGVDIDNTKITQLKNNIIPIYEPGLDKLLEKNKSRISFTTDQKTAIEQSDLIFIAVGTPQSTDGSANLQYVKDVAISISENLNSYKVVVVKSTVPVGTGDLIEKIISKKNDSAKFAVVSNPEFLKEGSAIEDFYKPDRIVIGTNDKRAEQLIKKLYQKLATKTLVTDRRSSELIKYASNAFLATKISFINSIAALAEKTGADVDSIAEGIGLDKRINPYFLKAGIGYGGSCFPKDVQALIHLSKQYDEEPFLLEAVEKINLQQKESVVKKLKTKLNLQNKKIAILGLAFKPNTDDIREAPSITIVKELIAEGSIISAWDPIAEKNFSQLFPEINLSQTPYQAIENSDAAIIVTEWEELKELDLKKIKQLMKFPLIIDGRNIIDPVKCRQFKIELISVGK